MVISYISLRTLIGGWGGSQYHKSAFFTDPLVRSLWNTKFRNQKCGGKRLGTRRSGFSLALVSLAV